MADRKTISLCQFIACGTIIDSFATTCRGSVTVEIEEGPYPQKQDLAVEVLVEAVAFCEIVFKFNCIFQNIKNSHILVNRDGLKQVNQPMFHP